MKISLFCYNSAYVLYQERDDTKFIILGRKTTSRIELNSKNEKVQNFFKALNELIKEDV